MHGGRFECLDRNSEISWFMLSIETIANCDLSLLA